MTMNCQGRYSVVPNSIRGIWVWGTSISEYGIEKAVEEFKEMGITDVFLLVKGTMGRVCWPSKIALATSQDVSVLPRTRAACSENNLRFHAWFIITQDKTYLEQNWTSGMWGIPIESEPVQEYRLGEHRCFRISTAVVDFASDIRYKEYVLSLIAEVINDYAPDGIHLDYIRYPNGAWVGDQFSCREQNPSDSRSIRSLYKPLELGEQAVTKETSLTYSCKTTPM